RPAQVRAGRGRVQVERVVPTLVERALHRLLVDPTRLGVEPVRVVRTGDAGEREREARVGAALHAGELEVQHGHLVGDLLGGQIADRAVGDDVDVHRHRRAEVRTGLADRRRGQVLDDGVVGRLTRVEATSEYGRRQLVVDREQRFTAQRRDAARDLFRDARDG